MNSKEFEAGYKIAKKNNNIYANRDDYKKIFNKDPIGGSKEWADFIDGSRQYEKEIIKTNFENQLLSFLEEYNKLIDKYNIEISSGCGCCGAGLYIKNNNYELEMKIPFTQKDIYEGMLRNL